MGEISLNELEARADAAGIDLLQIDLDSIQLPPGDDFGIISDDEDVYQEEQMDFDYGLGNTIVVDNLPVVPKEKFDKLEGVVRKIYSQIGVIKEDGLWMPVDPVTHKTLGYCFIEYNTPQEAELAKEKTNGYKLDRAHIFAVNMIEDFNRFMKVPDEWAPPEIRPYVPGENLQNWLTDEKARDQFVIRAGSDTEVFWNDARHLKPDPVYKRAYWTESFVQWSPLGTYLATVHRQGAAVWGGASTFNRLMRYAHPQVKLIDFSPGEKYLVTYSSHEPSNPRDANRVVINIFDVRTGKAMRDFKGSADEFAIGGKMEKKRPRISLSLFTTLTETFSMANKSPRNFKNGGSAVGLGIVAAMDESDKVSDFALSPRSSPVPVVSLKKPASCFKEGGIGVWNFDKGGVVVDENDESYTCVISHVGNNVIKKSVYYDDKVCVDSVSWFDVGSGLLYAASPPVMMPIDVAAAERREFWSKDFLSSCHLCKKLLEGLDIFMYRGENAFCSPECRDKHIRIEDFKEKSGSEALKKQECSVTPRSSPLLFFDGVAAA